MLIVWCLGRDFSERRDTSPSTGMLQQKVRDENSTLQDSKLGECQVDTFKLGQRIVRIASERTGTIWMEPSVREQLQLELLLLGVMWLVFLALVGIVATLVTWYGRRGLAASPKPALPTSTRAARSKAGVLDTSVLGGNGMRGYVRRGTRRRELSARYSLPTPKSCGPAMRPVPIGHSTSSSYCSVPLPLLWHEIRLRRSIHPMPA